MDEIIRIEDKAHCLLNKQCDRLKKLWGEGTYLTILHSVVVYVLALKANISCSMQDFFHEVLHGNFVDIDECLEAINRYPFNIIFIENPAHEMSLKAVKSNGLVLEFIENQTIDICLEAVKSKPFSIKYCKIQNDEICYHALKDNGLYLRFIKKENQNKFICKTAIDNNEEAIKFVKI